MFLKDHLYFLRGAWVYIRRGKNGDVEAVGEGFTPNLAYYASFYETSADEGWLKRWLRRLEFI